jgi:hypothetical protein
LDRGIARAGWRAEEISDGAVVFNKVLQAGLMELGVRPDHVKIGRKMIDALTEWAKRKGLGAEYASVRKKVQGSGAGKSATYQTVQRRIKPSDEALRGIAFAIANSMKKRGIFKPEFGGLRTLERTTKSLGPSYVRQEVVREIRKVFGM